MRERGTRLLLTFVAVGLLAAACGVGEPTAEGEIAQTADDYLRALAGGDTREACAQLTAAARATLKGPCGDALGELAARIGRDALVAAADGGVEVEVDGEHGFAEIRRLETRLSLVRAGDRWRISAGHTLEP